MVMQVQFLLNKDIHRMDEIIFYSYSRSQKHVSYLSISYLSIDQTQIVQQDWWFGARRQLTERPTEEQPPFSCQFDLVTMALYYACLCGSSQMTSYM